MPVDAEHLKTVGYLKVVKKNRKQIPPLLFQRKKR
jgi:hypothetical protein